MTLPAAAAPASPGEPAGSDARGATPGPPGRARWVLLMMALVVLFSTVDRYIVAILVDHIEEALRRVEGCVGAAEAGEAEPRPVARALA